MKSKYKMNQKEGKFGESLIPGKRPVDAYGCVDKVHGAFAYEIKTIMVKYNSKVNPYGRADICYDGHNRMKDYCEDHNLVPKYIFVICYKKNGKFAVLSIREASWDLIDFFKSNSEKHIRVPLHSISFFSEYDGEVNGKDR